MTKRATLGMALAIALLTVLAWGAAHADEIRLLSTVGMQPAVPELLAQFERSTGHTVKVTWGLAAVLKQQFADGTPADVLLLTSPLIDDLAKQGKVAAGSKVDVARSGVGVAVNDADADIGSDPLR